MSKNHSTKYLASNQDHRPRRLTRGQRRELDRISATGLAPVAQFILANDVKRGR